MDAILKLPAPVRHAIALFLGAMLAWGSTEVIPSLQDESNIKGGLLAAILTYLIAWATPLVSSYGVGAGEARRLGARTPSDGSDGVVTR